jgi:hypothetical protein
MLFAPGAPREAYFEGFGALADMTDDERREWFIRHDNFWVSNRLRVGCGRADEESVEAGRGLRPTETRDGAERPDQGRRTGQATEAPRLAAISTPITGANRLAAGRPRGARPASKRTPIARPGPGALAGRQAGRRVSRAAAEVGDGL